MGNTPSTLFAACPHASLPSLPRASSLSQIGKCGARYKTVATCPRPDGRGPPSPRRHRECKTPDWFCSRQLPATSCQLLVHRNLDDFLLDGVGHQLRLVVDVELAHQVEFVRLHG